MGGFKYRIESPNIMPPPIFSSKKIRKKKAIGEEWTFNLVVLFLNKNK